MDVREKLVELLKANFYDEYEFEEIADILIAHGVTVQEWISVEDRLPEEWENVLVWSKCGFHEVAVYLGIPGKWREAWTHMMMDVDTVTHWMPLPQPPKGE